MSTEVRPPGVELLGHRWEQRFGTGAQYEIVDPSTGEAVASLVGATVDDATRAVDAAADAFQSWRRTTVAERSRLLFRLADELETRADELALLDALCGGGPLVEMRRDVSTAIGTLRYFAGVGRELTGQTIPASENLHVTERVPYGVVVRIVAFNHPFLFSLAKAAAPLVAGNTVIIKPPEIAPLSAVLLAEVASNVLPPDVLNVVVGDGPDVPRALVRDARVFRIGFVGSERTGRAIQTDAAAVGVKHVTLELGGKNALLALDDVPPGDVAAAAVQGMNFTWAGQSCGSTSRLLVPDSIADDVVASLVERVGRLRCGPAVDPSTDVGPLASSAQRDRVEAELAQARRDGARVMAGGGRPDYVERGWFVEPTILDGVTPDMRVAQEEIFGPVLSVMRYSRLDEAVDIANDVRYGLTASIHTRDVGRAVALARELDAGFVWINGQSRHFTGVPYGGVKSSGYGRDESFEELVSYTQTKAITIFTPTI